MKIAILNNPASQGTLLGRALQDLNHEVRYFLSYTSTIQQSPDHFAIVGKTLGIPLERSLKKWYYYLRSKFDLVVLNGVPNYFRANAKVTWWHGTDIRSDPTKAARIDHQQYVSSPDLLALSSKFKLLNRIVDLELFSERPEFTKFDELAKIRESTEYLVCHLPSNSIDKGTSKIKDYIKSLQNEGYDIRLITTENRHFSRVEMLHLLSMCDLYIDQYVPNSGIVGITAFEAMLLGTPVAASLTSKGAETSELTELVTPITERSGKIWFDFEEAINNFDPERSKSYVLDNHSGDKAISILREDGIL